jgi:hypothetical protein
MKSGHVYNEKNPKDFDLRSYISEFNSFLSANNNNLKETS